MIALKKFRYKMIWENLKRKKIEFKFKFKSKSESIRIENQAESRTKTNYVEKLIKLFNFHNLKWCFSNKKNLPNFLT